MILETEKSLQEFFLELVEKAKKHQKVSITEGTQFYVVNLLSEFLDAKKLHTPKEPLTLDEPLALILGRALESSDPQQRYQLMKIIGDRSLYVSGFFSDSFRRKTIDMDYYIAMGERAYSCVSSISKEQFRKAEPFSEIFEELSRKFLPLVDILAEISESSSLTSDKDLLRLYERWLATGSQRISKQLQEKGILPVVCERDQLH